MNAPGLADDRLEDYRWLVSAEAEPWLQRADAADALLLATARQLRRSLGEARTHLVLEQAQLRRRARRKFDGAERLFFLAAALQQATDQRVAQHKAARFAGLAPIADLCCGIGGDLLQLARQGRATGFEIDPVKAALAAANCRVRAGDQASVLAADAQGAPLGDFQSWHVDPDRRCSGRRTIKLENYQPPLAALQRLLQLNPHAAVKLAPATAAAPEWCDVAEREWITSRGECRQQVAWFGQLARHPGRKTATLADAPGGPCSLTGRGGGAPPLADRIGQWIYEPHPAILAADLTAEAAHRWQLQAVAPQVPYLTSDRQLQEAALSEFRVTDVLPFDLKKLRSLLQSREIGRLEIKLRRTPEQPERIRRRLRLRGRHSAVLLIAPLRRQVTAILAVRPGQY